MGKIRISELAEELHVESLDVLHYLKEQGVVEPAKRSSSSVEDDAAAIARAYFRKSDAGNGRKKPVKAGAEQTEVTVKKETVVSKTEEVPLKSTEKSGVKSSEKKEAVDRIAEEKPQMKPVRAIQQKTAERPEGRAAVAQKTAPGGGVGKTEASSHAGDGAHVRKKKKIIFVSNPNNSGGGPGYSSDAGRGRMGNRPRASFPGAQTHQLIRPHTAPSQPEVYNREVSRVEPPKPAASKAPVKEQAVEKPAPVAPAEEIRVVEAAVKTPENEPKTEIKSKQSAPAVEKAKPEVSVRTQAEAPAQPARGAGPVKTPVQGARPQRPAGQGAPAKTGQVQRTGSYGQNGSGRAGQAPGNRFGQQRPGSYAGTGRPGGYNQAGRGAGKPGQGGAARPGFAGAPQGAPGGRDGGKRQRGKEKDKRKDIRLENEESVSRTKRAGRFIKPEVKPEAPEEQIKVITIPETLTIKELAQAMHMQPSAIIKKLFLAGKIMTVNSEVSFEEAENIAVEYDIICEKEEQIDIIEELLKEDEDAAETLKKRPPVVCVMGHVDHGKTSLLDAIRKTNVTDREAGGITQAIGAYTVSVKGQTITFLDTPGHEAFTAMRMRGANATDIAVLVVAADDGVMPQTVEAINHAKAANVEIIVAVNKIDKPNANIDRVKQEMTEYGLIATDWGGQTEFVPVSAKTGEGLENLLETIILTADILELAANPDRVARGIVLEAQLDKGRGPVATVLVQKGTLRVGDFISAGACSGRVRAMVDDKGRRVKEAKPSEPVEILGLSDVPDAGEVFLGHDSDKEAKQYADTYLGRHKKELIDETKGNRMSLDNLFSKIEEGKVKELELIIKADVQGSVEALKQSLEKLSGDEVAVKIIHSGVGAITESDVSLAMASNAIIIGFDVRPDNIAKSTAEREGVEIKLYKVIYQVIDDIEAAMKGMLAPVYEEKIIGHAEVRQIFRASSVGNIAGSYILDGVVQKGCKVRIRRGEEQIYEGGLMSLKRFKDDVKEVREGYECGLVFEKFDAMNVGDTVEAYIMVEVPREKLEVHK